MKKERDSKKSAEKENKSFMEKVDLSGKAKSVGKGAVKIVDSALKVIGIVSMMATPVLLATALASFLGFMSVPYLTVLAVAGVTFAAYHVCRIARNWTASEEEKAGESIIETIQKAAA